MDKFKGFLEKETEKSIRAYRCRRCGGIKVKSYSLSMLAMRYKKRCSCG